MTEDASNQKTVVTIDTSTVSAAGDYDVTLESFDSNSNVKSTLMSNDITITVTDSLTETPVVSVSPETVIEPTVGPSFKTAPASKALIAGEAESWTLPEIEEGSFSLDYIELTLPEALNTQIDLI